MRKNKFFIAGLVTVFVALVSLTLVSSTWAKYTSTASGEDSAQVAKWAWTIEDKNLDVTNKLETIEFDLFNTINEEDTTSTESHVVAGKIAPGTGGSFVLDIANKSEVDATYAISFELTNDADVPLLFKVGDGEWKDSLDPVAVTEIAKLTGTSTVKVQWKWAFVGVDDVDTNLGKHAPTVKVKATVTMTQVD